MKQGDLLSSGVKRGGLDRKKESLGSEAVNKPKSPLREKAKMPHAEERAYSKERG